MNLQQFDPVGLALFVGALSLIPLLLICTTCFLKVSIVLMIVRNAIGVQQVPPSVAIYAIALSISLFVMAPIGENIKRNFDSIRGSGDKVQRLSVDQMIKSAEPLREFMMKNTSPEGRSRFLTLARKQSNGMSKLNESDYPVLVPAFVISELQLAFEIGFILYVPMVVIDLLISNLLLALGMQMVSPMVVAMPLKILLFVVLDGWTKLFEGLVLSYSWS